MLRLAKAKKNGGEELLAMATYNLIELMLVIWFI